MSVIHNSPIKKKSKGKDFSNQYSKSQGTLRAYVTDDLVIDNHKYKNFLMKIKV